MSSIKVLLVDDVRLFIEFERPFFERAGCSILTATAGDEALRIVNEEKPHIVLLDYEMPGMNGDAVCRRIKENEATKHIPVLIVTANRSREVQERCLKAGCTDFVTKPVSGRELLDKVVKILQIPYRVHLRTRVSMDVSLGLGADSVSLSGYSEDISEGGIYVETLDPVETGASVRVTFSLPGEKTPIVVDSQVVRVARLKDSGRYGVGLRFVAPEAGLVDRVRRFVIQEVGR
ncbi:MAG: response regulator [Acidobacteria bacterium]|nr:response regulator [Acidobacteriota bacterium]